MAITHSSAASHNGTGAATATSGAALEPVCPSVVEPNEILIAHVAWNDTTSTPATPSGWALLGGPYNIGTTPNGRHWIFGKIAVGDEDSDLISFGTVGGTAKRWGRIYRFQGRETGTITDLVPSLSFSSTAHATDPQMPSVTTTQAGALAVACVAQTDDNAVAAATGMTGGTWVEGVAEFVSTVGTGVMMQLQQCTPTADPGTVSGGSAATANDPCGVIGFEVRPNPAPPPAEYRSALVIAPNRAVFRAATW